MDLYAYCLCNDIDVTALDTVPGISGARPFIKPYDGISVIVSGWEGGPITVTRENVLSHEKVISHVFTQTTPLPFRFGALLRSAELDGYMNSNRRSLLAAIARVRGTAEMGVKIMNETRSGNESEQILAEPAESAEEPGRGALFLAAKQRELARREMNEGRAREIANWLDEQLEGVVNHSFVRLNPTAGLTVKAAHLVDRRRLEEYRQRMRRAREERNRLLFLTSGPWPPYSFCDLTAKSKD